MKKHTPKSAFANARSYVADGDERMASRMYVENRLSYKRYIQALSEGRAIRQRQIESEDDLS